VTGFCIAWLYGPSSHAKQKSKALKNDSDLSLEKAIEEPTRTMHPEDIPRAAEEFLGSEWAEQTACLILDLRMPGMNGLELQRRLTQNGSPRSDCLPERSSLRRRRTFRSPRGRSPISSQTNQQRGIAKCHSQRA